MRIVPTGRRHGAWAETINLPQLAQPLLWNFSASAVNGPRLRRYAARAGSYRYVSNRAGDGGRAAVVIMDVVVAI